MDGEKERKKERRDKERQKKRMKERERENMETQMAGREPSATKGNQEQMGNNLEMGLKEQVTL